MVVVEHLKEICTIGSIVGLWTIGLFLALRSGVVSLATGQGVRRLYENVSRAVLVICGCLVALALIQRAIGYNLGLM
jgi:hypothetical protein